VQNSIKGYQLIEGNSTSDILQYYPDVQMASAVLCWFVALLRQEPTLASLPIEIELIVANYVGKYPCIGVHYRDPNLHDVEPFILSCLALYRDSKPFGDFHQYLLEHEEEVSAFKKRFDEYTPFNSGVQ